MYLIHLDSETDFDDWRKTARALALHHVAPADVTWSVQGRAKDDVPPGLCEAPAFHQSRPMALSTCPPTSSNSHASRSCITTVSALRCSIGCCGGCGAITICSTPGSILTSRWRRRWPAACIATYSGCATSSVSARSDASTRRITPPGSCRSITSSNSPPPSSRAVTPTCPGRSSRQTCAPIGMVMRSRSPGGSARRRSDDGDLRRLTKDR